MNTISALLPTRPSRTKIVIGRGVSKTLPHQLPDGVHRIIILTDSRVKSLYGTQVLRLFNRVNLPSTLLSFSAGEQSKNSTVMLRLVSQLLRQQCGRDSVILALGGGVVGDMAGFVAATYMRGIPYIQIPTTLLAMVDSAIGGKVGIDLPEGKNLLGAFYHPHRILVDLNYLLSLPDHEWTNGYAEMLKIFLTRDAQTYFAFIRDLPTLKTLRNGRLRRYIERAIALKLQVVTRDPEERGARMIVNFGHTIGHAIETLSHYTIPHGCAVGLGMLVEAKISELMHILAPKDFLTISEGVQRIGIDHGLLRPFSAQNLIRLTQRDKKRSLHRIRYVLLEKIGRVKIENGQYAHPVEATLVRRAFQIIQSS